MGRPRLILRVLLGLAWLGCAVGVGRGADATGIEEQLRGLAEQNRRLQEQVEAQQKRIESLAAKLDAVEKKAARPELAAVEERDRRSADAVAEGNRETDVRVSGELGLAFFHTGRAGAAPNSEFRVDDARLFVETPVVKDVYFYAQLDLRTREGDDAFEFGELYVDFEDVSGRLGGRPRLVNVRAGQLNIPFGEEYLARGPVANPLISHSLSDVWGYDPGVELYGALGAWQYVVAVQNGGSNTLRDYNADKAVTAKLGWTPAPWLQLSASAGRSGEIKVNSATAAGDGLSALWFGTGFFRSISPSGTARTFWVDLWEGDATVRWKTGRAGAALGGVRYGDDDYAGNNARRLRYGFLEAVQQLAENFYGAARFSAVSAPQGYPVAGWGNVGRYFFAPAPATELKRLSLGFGYKLGPPLVLKLEYAWEWGRQLSGAARDQEDFFGAEVGLTF